MSNKRVLTGITTTGTPHLGNYVGAIRPAVAASKEPDVDAYLFLADYHALIKCHEPAQVPSPVSRSRPAGWPPDWIRTSHTSTDNRISPR